MPLLYKGLYNRCSMQHGNKEETMKKQMLTQSDMNEIMGGNETCMTQNAGQYCYTINYSIGNNHYSETICEPIVITVCW